MWQRPAREAIQPERLAPLKGRAPGPGPTTVTESNFPDLRDHRPTRPTRRKTGRRAAQWRPGHVRPTTR